MTLDAEIDALYQRPPGEFTAARNALAKTLTGEDRNRVRALGKPTNVAWAVNQVYWHDRRLFDALVRAGEKLKAAQLAALKGKSVDLRGATAAQRAALSDAVAAAERHAREAGLGADLDDVTRTLEALAIVPDRAAPGRLTEALQPSGFELFAGAAIPSAPPAERGRHEREEPHHRRAEPPARDERLHKAAVEAARRRDADEKRDAKARAAEERRAAQARAHEERRAARARQQAQRALARAREAEARARQQWEAAQHALRKAEAAAK